MKKLLFMAILFNFYFNLSAQVRTGGGGTPDADDTPKPHIKLINDWVEKSARQWEKCYQSKMPATNLVDLWHVLIIKEATLASNNPSSCDYTPNQRLCFFENQELNNYVLPSIADWKTMTLYFQQVGIPVISQDDQRIIRKFYFERLLAPTASQDSNKKLDDQKEN